MLLILILPSALFAKTETGKESEFDLFSQGSLREERSLQFEIGVYPHIQSVGIVYNINRYFSAGWFYQKDYNFQMKKAYSTKEWAMDSIYRQNGDWYIYGASTARLDWSGPQTFLNFRFFPFPDIPIYLSANIGRDIFGDSGKHNVLLSFDATNPKWVIGHPIYMEQEGTPYWFRTAGIGTVIHLPFGLFLDAQYSRGMYTNYVRTMHIYNDERLFAVNGFRVTEDGKLTPADDATMTPEDIVLSTYLMDARHRERGHSGPHVIYGVWIGYSTGI